MAAVSEMCSLALRYHQEGHLAQAEQLYRQILQADPNHADAHHLLGVLAYQANRFDLAISLIQRAIELSPTAVPYHSNLGLALEGFGRRDSAIASYRHGLRLNPGDAAAIDNLGAALMRQGRFQEVVDECRRFLKVRPDTPQALQHLAHALSSIGQTEEAVAHFEQALHVNPRFVEAHNNLGNTLLQVGRTEEAAEHFRQALKLRPNMPAIYNNLGRVLQRQGKLNEAIDHYRAAIRIDPNFAQGYNNLGSTLAQQRKFEEAIANYREALRVDPNFAEAHSNLGAALVLSGDIDAAGASCRQAIAVQPKYADAYNNLGGVLVLQGNLAEAAAAYRIAHDLQPNLLTTQSNLLFCMNYDPEANPDIVFAEHRRWGQTFCKGIEGRSDLGIRSPDHAPRIPRGTNHRLRIGYVSPDFRQHAIIRYFEPVLAHHNAECVETFCYSEVAEPDAATSRLQKSAHHWRRIRGLNAKQAEQMILDDRIDILVDLAGHTAGNRLDIFALKPAPLQATWLGYLNTTGLPTVDYRITDEILDPVGEPVRDTEEPFRLAGGFCCFEPWPHSPTVGPLPAASRGYLTFGSLHNLFKLNQAVFDLWSRVLHAVPSSRLLMFRDTLKGSARKRVFDAFIKRGISPERLDIREVTSEGNRLREGGHLDVFAEIDVSLDAFPWTGGVTTCESLWMGVPVLSLAGVRPPARTGVDFDAGWRERLGLCYPRCVCCQGAAVSRASGPTGTVAGRVAGAHAEDDLRRGPIHPRFRAGLPDDVGTEVEG